MFGARKLLDWLIQLFVLCLVRQAWPDGLVSPFSSSGIFPLEVAENGGLVFDDMKGELARIRRVEVP